MTQLATTTHPDLSKLAHLVTDSVNAVATKRAYSRAVTDFASWFMAQSQPLCKATVNTYKSDLIERDLSASAINQKLTVVRKLVCEAADNGLLDQQTANAISRIKGVPRRGTRLGNWLSEEESQELISLPDVATIKGLRDRAVMAVLIGCGLRRSEVAKLAFKQIQRREGRWVIVDVDGKGHRLRSVPIPSWVKKAIDAYVDQSHDRAGFVFRQTNKHGGTQGASISPDTVRLIVKHYGPMIGQPKLAPHDLRRTFAQWLRREGVKIEQISVILGHESIVTTQKYLGIWQDIKDAPNDRIRIKI